VLFGVITLVNIFDLIVIQPIFNLLLGLYSLIPGGDFGIALIIFTVLVRLALWPLVKKQLHQVKAMQKLQPELVKIKNETKGNKQLEGMRMMELYKKHDVSPFRSIGILLIQLPIFIALYQVIQIFIYAKPGQVTKYVYSFLQNLEPVKALISHPESFNHQFLGFLNLTKTAIINNPFSIDFVLFALAIAAAITQYIMSKQTAPKQQTKKRLRDIMNAAADGKQADQNEMNAAMMGKMTTFLPIMMLFIMVSLPGALVLYYTVSNLVAVIQQRSILKQDSTEMIAIADKAPIVQNKKATAKAREKQAQEANIIRITAKDTAPKMFNKKEKL
jgi:YidC/Oxa1 family membrane protein insertase